MTDDQITAASVLPARRHELTLMTDDGLALVGELALPRHWDPVATIVCVHPLPTHGGMMDSHVLRKASWRLPALASTAVLRFNTRGTTSAAGTSQGSFDQARGEGLDLHAAINYVREHSLPAPWLVGWSFGTDVILRHAETAAAAGTVAGVLLLSPPLRYTTPAQLEAWAQAPVPVIALVPEFDDYLPPEPARERFSVLPNAQVVDFPGAKHLWVGERYVRQVLNAIVEHVNPDAAPLPTRWTPEDVMAQGPMDKWSDV